MVAVRVPSRTILPITEGSLFKLLRPEPVGQHRRAGCVRAVVAGASRRPRTGRSPMTSK